MRALVLAALHVDILLYHKEIVIMLRDSNTKVKESAARILSRVAENYPETFLINQNSLKLLEIVLEATQGPAKVSRYSLWIISYLTENLSKYTQSRL